jgi:hypothetical protein
MLLPLGKPPMTILLVTLETDPYPLLLGEILKRGSGMGVMALEAEPMADLGVLVLFILLYDLFMALGAVDDPHPLRMGEALNIGMAIGTVELMVDRGSKLIIIHIEANPAFPHLLLPRGRNNQPEPLFIVHLEDIGASMAFETRLVLYRKCNP